MKCKETVSNECSLHLDRCASHRLNSAVSLVMEEHIGLVTRVVFIMYKRDNSRLSAKFFRIFHHPSRSRNATQLSTAFDTFEKHSGAYQYIWHLDCKNLYYFTSSTTRLLIFCQLMMLLKTTFSDRNSQQEKSTTFSNALSPCDRIINRFSCTRDMLATTLSILYTVQNLRAVLWMFRLVVTRHYEKINKFQSSVLLVSWKSL